MPWRRMTYRGHSSRCRSAAFLWRIGEGVVIAVLAVAAGVGFIASIPGARWALVHHDRVAIMVFWLSCSMMLASAAGGAFALADRAPLGPAWAIVMQDGDGTHYVMRPERYTNPHACWIRAATRNRQDAIAAYFCAEIP